MSCSPGQPPFAEGLSEAELGLWSTSIQRWLAAVLKDGAEDAWGPERWREVSHQANELGLWPDPLHMSASEGWRQHGLPLVAEACAGLAWGVHRIGLGRWLAAQAGGAMSASSVAVYAGAGCWGLAPEALAPWWCGRALDAEQRELLRGWAALPGSDWTLLLPSHWTHLVRATLNEAGGRDLCWQWRILSRECADARIVADGLGLAPLQRWSVRAQASDWQPMVLSAPRAEALWRSAFLADQRGAMLVAGHSVVKAEQAATLHATTRWQGGALLREHAGVQVRLGQMQSALRDIGSRLTAWPCQPADGDLPNLLLDRLDLHDRCLALSDEALQLMGAAGYLRDTTVARAWRDQRILRQLAGGVADVHRMVALCRAASEGAA